MEKEMIAIDVLEMTSNGLQKIVQMELEEPCSDEKAWAEVLNEMTEKAYKMEKMFITTSEWGFSIQNLKQKTIVFKGVFRVIEKQS